MKTKAQLEAEIRLLNKELAEDMEYDRLEKKLEELKAKKRELDPKRRVARKASKVMYGMGVELGKAFQGIARNYEKKGKKRKSDYEFMI
jgi:hypothetical protein